MSASEEYSAALPTKFFLSEAIRYRHPLSRFPHEEAHLGMRWNPRIPRWASSCGKRLRGWRYRMASDKKNFVGRAAEYSSLALILPASTFVGYGIGYWLDQKFGT